MIKLAWSKRFKTNLKKYIAKHPEMECKKKDKLKIFVKDPYAYKLQNHKLSGKLKDLRSIVIDYDCRIVFAFVEQDIALLVNIGTHEEIY